VADVDRDEGRTQTIEEIKREYSEKRCTDLQQLLSTMANPIRFRILCALRVAPFSVTELVEITDSNLSNVSQHLKMMWMAGYVTRERHGKHVSYALTDARVRDAIEVFENMFPADEYAGARPGCE
jgi:ArsR family transcriptional regulator